MIVQQITTQYRILCDHCGTPASDWDDSVLWARQKAKENRNFHYTSWTENGAQRELWLCETCYRKFQETVQRGNC